MQIFRGALASLILFLPALPAAAQTLRAERIRLTISGTRELVQIRNGSRWEDALDSRGPGIRINNADGKCQSARASLSSGRLTTRGSCPEGSFVRELQMGPDADLISVTVRFTPKPGAAIQSVEDRTTFAPKPRATDTPAQGPLDFVWSQNIKSDPKQVDAHWDFKSPAVMFQQGPIFAAIIPRLDLLTADDLKNAPPALDLGVLPGDHAWFSYGVVSADPSGHSYFRRSDKPASGPFEFRYWILASAEPEKLGYRRVTDLMWAKFGNPALHQTIDLQQNARKPELFLFDDWRKEAWTRYANEKYFEFDCGTNRKCGAIASNREPSLKPNNIPKEDAWFNSWFQNLRTAYGWYLYGQRSNDADIKRKAEQVLNLALTSPRHEGAFSTIYLHDTNTWIKEDGWAGFADDYHTFCMSWTGYWMLRWAEDLLPGRTSEILMFLRPYGDFLLRVQQPSGLIPSWIGDDMKPRKEFSDFNAETAGSALFLAELYHSTNDKKYLDAALRAQDFVTREVLPRERWFDFETFLSCARKPFDFYDRETTQYPQNNLSTMQAAQAYLALYRATGKPELLEIGKQVVDYLLLAQQSWNHPLFGPKLLGGMTTQNTDAEWSDARQAYAAALLFDYYRETSRLDYLERSIAAARSGFAVAPWENWAHTGYADRPGALTGFHWGTGSQTATVEMMADLGDAYVNILTKHGAGFNACTIENVRVVGSLISFDLKTAKPLQPVLIRFAGLDHRVTYRIVINNSPPIGADGATLLLRGLKMFGPVK